jgi:hypothetical protein
MYYPGTVLSGVVIASGASAPATGAPEPVQWTALANTSASGSTLTKTASSYDWDAGAISVQRLNGAGYVEFTANETSTYRMVGLGAVNTDAGWVDMDWAIYLRADGGGDVRQSGQAPFDFGAYQVGDRFRVAVSASGTVTYSRNGSVFYTSSVTASFPLFVDTTMYYPGTVLSSVVISGAGGSGGGGGGGATCPNFLEADYLALNPDVAFAIGSDGLAGTGWSHYDVQGRSEGRAYNASCAPQAGGASTNASTACPAYFQTHYLTLHPDVANAINTGAIPGGTWHYDNYGRNEGRQYNFACAVQSGGASWFSNY